MNARDKALVAGTVLLGSVLMLSLAWGLQHAALANPPLLGKPAPRLAIQTQTGQLVSVEEQRGRPVVLNFWASWCAPCVQELPVLSDGAATRPGVEFVGADNQDTMSGFTTFEASHGHPYPAGPIVLGRYQDYGVAGLPVTFFIDAQGRVAASFSGPLDATTLNHYLALVAP